MSFLSSMGVKASFVTASLTALLLSTSAQAGEAPMLADMVAAGDLPPLEERLPTNPRVIAPYEEIGTYGGTWRRAYKGASDDRGPQKLMEARIVRFVQNDENGFSIEPGWVSSFSANDTSTEFTFTIREGLRWSDGDPVSTEDVSFYFEHVMGEGNPYAWRKLLSTPSGNATLTVVDDLTFKITFLDPSPLFIQRLGRDYTWLISPSHYMKQFHPAFASEEELAAAAEKYGVETWQDLWGRRGKVESFFLNPELPVLSAWKIETPPPAETSTFVRNPYYYGVDTEGNQLPYIDRISHDLFQDVETLNLWVAQGRIDLQQRHISVGNFPFFKENEAKGDYTTTIWKSLNVETLWPNQTTDDAVLAGLFQDPKFREALNLAVDRETINEVSYAGLGTPMQASPAKGSLIHDADFVNKWVDYDPDTADALLDELGLTERDSDGYRLRSDGETLEILITTPLFATDIKTVELVADNWKDIGIKVTIEVIERSAYLERAGSNNIQMGHWNMGRAANFMIEPAVYEGQIVDSPWAIKWGSYRKDPSIPVAELPPEGHLLNKIWDMVDQADSAGSEKEAMELGAEILKLHGEAPNWVGLVGGAPNIFIKSNRLGNFPQGFIRDDITRDIGIIPTEQLFIKQ